MIIISIHLMLLFIIAAWILLVIFHYFNTSHVTVYLCLGSDRKRNIRYFNTSHVTVYQRFGRPFRSRYLISIHLMLLFIAPLVTIFQSTLLNFNTSHVTVYPYGILHYYLFVSYFNTSHVTVYPLQLCTALGPSLISIHLMLLFIASALFLLPPFGIISIHLMLLFIKVENPKIREETHFNTSHVTVYLYAGVSDPEVSSISIHLMLLFILTP